MSPRSLRCILQQHPSLPNLGHCIAVKRQQHTTRNTQQNNTRARMHARPGYTAQVPIGISDKGDEGNELQIHLQLHSHPWDDAIGSMRDGSTCTVRVREHNEVVAPCCCLDPPLPPLLSCPLMMMLHSRSSAVALLVVRGGHLLLHRNAASAPVTPSFI